MMDPEMRVSMLARLNLMRIDYMREAEKLAHFVQSTDRIVWESGPRRRQQRARFQARHTQVLYVRENRAFKSEVLTPKNIKQDEKVDFVLAVQNTSPENHLLT